MFPQCMAIKVYIVFSGQYGQLYLCVLILPSDRLNLSFIGQRWLGGSYCCFWTLNTVTITGDRVNRSKPRPVGLHHYFTLWPIIFQQPRLFRGYVPFSSRYRMSRNHTTIHWKLSHSSFSFQISITRLQASENLRRFPRTAGVPLLSPASLSRPACAVLPVLLFTYLAALDRAIIKSRAIDSNASFRVDKVQNLPMWQLG